LSANIKNIDLWGEYAYLANKVDWVFRIDRRVLDQETETVSQKVRFNRAELKGIYPLNLQSKLSLSAMLTTNRAFDQYNVSTPEIVSNYLGGRLNYTFDNSVYWAENLRTGFRMFAGVEYQHALNQQSFTRFNLDARHYLKISNSLLLATRFSASHALGLGAPQTILGGMDNWLFIDREERNKENPLGTNGIAQPNVFMSDFATTLRGFRMNKLSGNSHLLFNAELRIPLKSLVGSAYSKSQFINTFQMVGFFDAGSAWTGANPFARSNGFNTNVYGGNTNPFRATVTDFRNPFLFGYGIGARANVVGYFIKLDYAYGIENDEVKSPMTYLTLGHDF
jgi:outer membrane protein assembly factor BamA